MDLFAAEEAKNISFLTFDSNFIISDKSQIIFAANGLCKTTVCEAIRAAHANDIAYFSYENDNDVVFKGKYNKCTIGCDSVSLKKSEETISGLEEKLDCRKAIGAVFGISKQKDSVLIDIPLIKDLYEKSEPIKSVVKLTKEQRDGLKPILESNNGITLLIKHLSSFRSLASLESELNALKDAYIVPIQIALGDVEQHKADIAERGCPLCGDKRSDVYDRILAKIGDVAKEKDCLFFQFSGFTGIPNETKESTINLALKAIKSLSNEQAVSLLFTNGVESTENEIIKNIADLTDEQTNLANLKKQRDDFYSSVSSNQEYVQSNLKRFYPGSNIEYDDKEKSVAIELPIKQTSYSSGEFHDIYSTVKFLSFEGSQKHILIVDDPLSSLDLANQYKMVFRFVRLASQDGKSVVIFTHNLDLINMANEQCPKIFEYKYVDVLKCDPSTNNRVLSLFPIETPDGLKPVISLDKIRGKNASYDPYLECLMKRSEKTFKDISNKLFHYDGKFEDTFTGEKAPDGSNPSYSVSNDYLVSLIDSFSELRAVSFFESVETKIMYICALRVWVEKQFWNFADAMPKEKGDNLKKKLADKGMLQKKIELLYSEEFKSDFMLRFPKCHRENLMSEKTLLNETMHCENQIHPFHYAMCISVSDLNSEISEVKSFFSK